MTALLTIEQIKDVYKSINPKTEAILSIFSGRIADTGIDPIPLFKKSLNICKKKKKVKLLWASTREVYNIYQADNIKAHIITVPYSILEKINLFKMDLKKLSLDTVKTFYKDAKKANFKIKI